MEKQEDISDRGELRRCRWCGKIKPTTEFKSINGVLCKSCRQRSVPKSFSYIDMVGERYDKLVVLKRIVKTVEGKRRRGALWLCICDCGNEKIVERRALIRGQVKSCGKCGYARPRGDIMNPRFCKNCGKVIPISHGRGPVSGYCSRYCQNKYNSESRRQSKICIFCGKEYITSNYRTQKYCPDCKGKWAQDIALVKAEIVLDTGVKTCARCHMSKNITEFGKRSNTCDGYNCYCKKCCREKWAELKAAGKIVRNKEKRNARAKFRRDTDPAYKLKCRMSRAVWDSLRDNHGKTNNKRGRKWESLVGFTLDELRAHLEAQFHDGMSWDTTGDWHIDHILPVSFFKFESTDDLDFQTCWSLENLRPMWATDNRVKHTALP